MQVFIDSFVESFTENLAAQIVGIVALLVNVLSYQFNKRSQILVMQFVAGFLFALHYFLLGAYAGAIANVLGVTRSLAFLFRGKNKLASHPLCPVFFVVLSFISVAFTYQNFLSLLPSFAFLSNSIALWSDRPKITRIFTIPNNSLFLIYNISTLSYSGIISDIFVLVSLIIAFVRFDILRLDLKGEKTEA